MIKLSKLLTIVAFISSIIVLIVGIVKPINGMIIGGVVGIMGSAMLLMTVMIQSNNTYRESTKNNVEVKNPLPDV
jgi:hypothetical protein